MKNEKPSVKEASVVEAEDTKAVKTPARKAPARRAKKAETAAAVKAAGDETATETKAAAKKAPAQKATVKETVYLQYLGKEIDVDDITKQAKEHWTKVQKKKAGDIKSINIYLKPEENAAYFVINDDVSGSVDL